MLRAGVLHMDIYLSQAMFYNSVTVLVVGVYFLAMAVSAKAVSGFLPYTARAFLLFLASLGLCVLLLSHRVRQTIKNFVSRHVRRQHFDHRRAWTAFTKGTANLLNARDLCSAAATMVSEILDIPSVSIWLKKETQQSLKLGGSSVLFESQLSELPVLQEGAADFLSIVGGYRLPIDLKGEESHLVKEFNRSHPRFLKAARIRTCLSMANNGDLLGIVTLDHQESLSLEAVDLLKSMTDQLAANLIILKLSERLRQSKEMEAFQTVAAFFVHDLKNLATKLSQMLENMQVHFDNPTFRDDALGLVCRGVDQINTLCGRLTLLRENLQITPLRADVNDVVCEAVASLDYHCKCGIAEDLQPLPTISLDAEQLRKVLTNLILNADEAMGGRGKIHVTTEMQNGWVVVSVSDEGCGISKEFLDQCLFRPFKTTKKQGMGIGLFQSKMIVEAHNGKIQVESREGEGSTFRVLLPMNRHGAGSRGNEQGAQSKKQ
jgi:putative PEP-CTERM system histidine kinase